MASKKPRSEARRILVWHSRRIVKVLWRFAGLFGGVIVFALLAASLDDRPKLFFDGPILDWARARRSAARTGAMQAITHLGDGVVLTAVAIATAAALGWRRHFRSATFIATAAAGAGLINGALKLLFARPRPRLGVTVAEGFAFPSGHSMVSAATYGAIAIVVATRFPRWRAPIIATCMALVLLIGVSRAYLHVHYPSDVLAGWALGITWPLWLKPLVLGRGFRRETVPDRQLEADRFPPPR